MNLIVTALKQRLAPFDWVEAARRDGEQRAPMSAVRGAAVRQLLAAGPLPASWPHYLSSASPL